MKTIYLVGFMGSGKSTIGELLHHHLNRPHLDTDQMIVDQYGDIASIFQREGEKQFRDYETEVLARIPGDHYVVSTGGGIVERQENHKLMKHNGLIIYLDASFAEIAERLGNDPTRPLWGKQNADKQQLYQRRRKCYRALADYTIMTDQKTPENIVNDILALLP